MMDRFRKRGGFTLLELMIVVVILAILAVVAVFSYKKYMRKARTQEAMGVLGEIKIKQAQFMASFGRYVSTSNGISEWSDDAGYYPHPFDSDGKPMPWTMNCQLAAPDTPEGGFCQLGVRASNATYFQYKTVGWDPNTPGLDADPPSDSIDIPAWQNNGSPRWWYASARTWWDPEDRRPHSGVVVLLSVITPEPVVKEEMAVDFAQ